MKINIVYNVFKLVTVSDFVFKIWRKLFLINFCFIKKQTLLNNLLASIIKQINLLKQFLQEQVSFFSIWTSTFLMLSRFFGWFTSPKFVLSIFCLLEYIYSIYQSIIKVVLKKCNILYFWHSVFLFSWRLFSQKKFFHLCKTRFKN